MQEAEGYDRMQLSPRAWRAVGTVEIHEAAACPFLAEKERWKFLVLAVVLFQEVRMSPWTVAKRGHTNDFSAYSWRRSLFYSAVQAL